MVALIVFYYNLDPELTKIRLLYRVDLCYKCNRYESAVGPVCKGRYVMIFFLVYSQVLCYRFSCFDCCGVADVLIC